MGRQRSLEVIQQAEWVTIGELVRLTNVRYSTLKFYTEEGMIPFEQAEENLTRRYRRTEACLLYTSGTDERPNVFRYCPSSFHD